MAFPSVYEMNNLLTSVRKQHFWEYFSGSKLPTATSAGVNYTFSSNSGWGSSNATVSGGSLTVNTSTASGTNRAASYDLGSAQDGLFTLKFKVTVPTQGHNSQGYANGLGFGLSSADHSTSSLSNQDFIGANYMHDNIDRALGGNWSKSAKMHSNACSGSDSTYGYPITSSGACNPGQDTWAANTSRWIKIERTSDTTFVVSYYTSSGYGTPAATRTITMSSVPSGLQYIVFKNMYLTSTQGNGETVTISELTFESSTVDNVRWDQTSTGSTGAMSDENDGGYLLTTGTTNNDIIELDFNDTKQFSHDASEVISVWKLGGTGNYNNASVGLMSATYALTGVNQAGWVMDNSINSTKYFMKSGNSGGVGYVWTTVPFDTNYHVFKSILSSSGMTGSIDGVAVGTNTTNLPTGSMQPHIHRQNKTGSGTYTLNVKYFEAYNT